LHDYGFTCAKKTNQRNGTVCNDPALGRCIRCAGEQYGVAKAAVLAGGLSWSRRRHAGVARFLAISGSIAEAFTLNGGVDPEKVLLVPSFVPDDAADSAAGTTRPAFLPVEDGYLMFAGALGRHKGVDVLLAAHRSMRTRVPLVLIGTTRQDTADVLAQAGPDVLVATNVPHPDVMYAWRHAALAVVPSVWEEPFGLVAVEAMLAGTPVIASATGGLNDVVADDETGVFVPPGNVVALTTAIDDLLREPDRMRRLAAAAVVRGWRFTASVVVPQIEAVYDEVLAHP